MPIITEPVWVDSFCYPVTPLEQFEEGTLGQSSGCSRDLQALALTCGCALSVMLLWCCPLLMTLVVPPSSPLCSPPSIPPPPCVHPLPSLLLLVFTPPLPPVFPPPLPLVFTPPLPPVFTPSLPPLTGRSVHSLADKGKQGLLVQELHSKFGKH